MTDNMPTTPRVRLTVDDLIANIDTSIGNQIEITLGQLTREQANTKKINKSGRTGANRYDIFVSTDLILQVFNNLISPFINRLGEEINQEKFYKISVSIFDKILANMGIQKENLTEGEKGFLSELLPPQVPLGKLFSTLQTD
ncbi:MAG: hypothetical protein ACMG57_02300 [Candidatus Dojkabacteria bacterium]